MGTVLPAQRITLGSRPSVEETQSCPCALAALNALTMSVVLTFLGNLGI